MEEKTEKIIFYFSLLIAVGFLIFLLVNNTFTDYKSFKEHRNYLRENNIQIQDWMTPSTILRNFNLSQKVLFDYLNTTNSSANLLTPVSGICLKQNTNCTILVEKLNQMVK